VGGGLSIYESILSQNSFFFFFIIPREMKRIYIASGCVAVSDSALDE
jgi:hypothetical protein